MTQLQHAPGKGVESVSSGWIQRSSVLWKHPMLLVLAAEIAVTSIVYPGFWAVVNLQNLLSQNAPLTVAAAGMTLVIIGGGFDLSVGAVFGAGAVFYVSLDGTLPVGLAILAVVLAGAVFGLFNGAVVNLLGVNPFVATLGSASAISGLVSLYYFHDSTKYTKDASFKVLGTHQWLGIPASFVVAAVVVVILGLVLAKTTYGRSVYAVGGNTQAARLSGLRVGFISASTFVVIGILAAIGGLLQASAVGTADPTFGATLTLQAIAVVIIGGTSLLGGEGAAWRTVVGIAILAVLNNVFAAKSLDPNLQLVIQGLIVIIAVAAEVWFQRRKTR
jgi:ribose transport system permease protein